MEKYDYYEEVKKDVIEYIKDHDIIVSEDNIDTFRDSSLYDDMFVSDSVTGNGSGSYTFNAWKAEEYVCHNLDLFAEAMEEFGYTDIPLDKVCSAEYIDVTIRCYILSQVLDNVLEELMEDNNETD